MFWLGQFVEWLGIALLVSILVFLLRRGLSRRYPLFTLYAAYMTVTLLARALTLSRPHLYFYVYWTAEPGALVLKLLALGESFLKVFRGFYLLARFRLLLPGAILVALAVSVLRTLSHPTQGSRATSIVVSGEMAVQYIALVVAVLFVGLVVLLRLPWRVHEYRIVLGFGISALGTFSSAGLRFFAGSGFGLLRSMVESAAYILALAIWVSAARYSSTSRLPAEPKVSPGMLVDELRRELAYTRSMLGR